MQCSSCGRNNEKLDDKSLRHLSRLHVHGGLPAAHVCK